jgi:RNA recognition motif-containing protein
VHRDRRSTIGKRADRLEQLIGFRAYLDTDRSGKEGVLKARLFVGNLSRSTTEDDISHIFSESGSVSGVELITVQNVGSPKTFAFVDMDSEADARQAISRLDGAQMKGRKLKVNIAHPREQRPEGQSWYNDPPPPIPAQKKKKS